MLFLGYVFLVYIVFDVIYDLDWEDIDLLEWVYSILFRDNNKILFGFML